MTLSDIERTVELFVAAGRRTIPVPIAEWREMMATRIGAVDKRALAKGKIKSVDKTPKPLRGAKHRKAARIEKGLRANRKGKA